MLSTGENENSGITLEDIVNFICDTANQEGWDGYSPNNVACEIFHAIQRNACGVAVKNGAIIGVISCVPDYDKRILYIRHINSIDKDSWKLFIELFEYHYKGFRITAKRHGKTKEFDTERTLEKLLKIYGRRCTNSKYGREHGAGVSCV
jgi:hypothetical protein